MIKIEINGVQDLIAFVSIIRGKDLNAEEIAKLTTIINTNSDVLSNAVQTQEKKDAESGS
jgi:hypothetical protein